MLGQPSAGQLCVSERENGKVYGTFSGIFRVKSVCLWSSAHRLKLGECQMEVELCSTSFDLDI